MRSAVLSIALAFLALTSASGAQAGPPADPFTVTNIPVDASAASAVEAQTIAINSGKERAWQAVLRRLLKQQDLAKVPTLDDVALTRLIASYLPQNVRRSTTRYVASMTYSFNPAAVRHLLRVSNIAYTDVQTHPILIVALSPRWVPHSPWAGVWSNPKYSGGALPLVSPIGDALDAAELSGVDFGGATWADVEPSASRVKATEAMLVLVTVTNGQTVVKMRRLGIGSSPPVPNVTVPGAPPKTLGAAADAASIAIANYWKSRMAIDFGHRSHLPADVHIASLSQWGGLLAQMATVPTITDVGVNAMDMGEARVAITYVGTADQLRDSLAQAKIDLKQRSGGGWSLGPLQTPDDNSDTGAQ